MKKIVVMRSGERREITGELGKYWLFGEQRLRKLNPNILRVEELAEKPTNKPADTSKNENKSAGKKKKKSEE